MLKIAITGTKGRMNQALLSAIQVDSTVMVDDDFEVFIDFSRPETSLRNLEICRCANKKMVIGTTGFSEDEKRSIQAASSDIAIVFAPNTSLGVNVCYSLLKQAAAMIGHMADIDIIEAHHKQKIDKPSGTALKMANVITEAVVSSSPKIHFSSIRAGDIIGEHTVSFTLLGERLEIIHKASTRATFASGAIFAAKWLASKPAGLYTMADVLASHQDGLLC